MKLKTALFYGNGNFVVYDNSEDAGIAFRAIFKNDRSVTTRGVYELDSTEHVPLSKIVGRLGDKWYIRVA